jgi:Antirestriction protein (ArdA)
MSNDDPDNINNETNGKLPQKSDIENYYTEPYNRNATGFTFSDYADFETKSAALLDSFGNKVEEFEILIVDHDRETSELFNACSVRQANLDTWFNDVVDLQNAEKAALYFLAGVQGYSMFTALAKYRDVTLFKGCQKDAAREWFNEIYLHSIPEHLHFYIDHAQFARDCEVSGDLSEFEFAGTTYTCTNSGCL